MSSMYDSIRRDVPERVRSYKPQALADLLETARTSTSLATGEAVDAVEGTSPGAASAYSRSPYPPGGAYDTSIAERVAAQRAAREAELRAKDEEFKKKIERRMLEDSLRKEQHFQEMYQDVLGGLSNSSGIMGETKYILEHSSKIKHKKKGQLYDEWNTEVFDKIQGRLQKRVDALSERSIETRLKGQMDAYLHTTNTKLGVFRDVIIEADYNPLAVHDNTIKVPTGDIRDPLKRDMLKPLYERQLMGALPDPTPLGKSTLDPKAWSDLIIHATPYGHCVDRTGDYIVRPLSGSVLDGRRSRVPMDHYNYPRDNAAAQQEMGRVGKGTVPAPGMQGGRKDLFDVMQQTCQQNPGITGGDRWLEAKGKANAPGPEERRGRKDLQEIIQQTSNPYKDGRSLGDQWLEAKGKGHAPGPEARRGRKDLQEIIQQTSNPYKDGRSLGDQWLEAKGKRPLPGPDVTIGQVIGRMDGPPDPRPPRDSRRSASHLVADMTLTVRN